LGDGLIAFSLRANNAFAFRLLDRVVASGFATLTTDLGVFFFFCVNALTTLFLTLLRPFFIAVHARCILLYMIIYRRDLRVALGL